MFLMSLAATVQAQPAAGYAAAVQADGPIAYWRFNDTGPVAVNSGSLGAAADGTYQGDAAPGSQAPKPPAVYGFDPGNTALQLDGAGDFVTTVMGLMNGRPVFTMSGWLRRNANQGDRTGLWGQNDLVEFGYINNNTLEVWTDNGLHQSPDPTTNPFPNGEWAHVAFVSEGSPGMLKLYTNGVFANERTHTMPVDNTFPFNIGGGGVFDAIAANGNYFNGQIDEVAVFDKALSAAQIAAQYNAAPRSIPLPSVVNIGGNKIGTVTYNGGGSFTVVAGGNDIWAQRDEFTFAHTEVTGDFDVQVRVESLSPNARWSKAGIMVRESLSEFSRMAFLRVTPPDVATSNGGNGANDTKLAYRTGIDNVAGANGGEHEDPADQNAPAYPNAWLRLVRAGALIHASNSVDGVTWNFLASQDTATWGGGALPPSLYLGLGTSRHSGGPTATAEYRDFKFNYSGPFVLAGADSRGNPTGVRVAFNNPPGTGSLDPANYTLTTVSGPNVTVVAGLRFTTANDSPARDPLTFTLEGTTSDPAVGAWQLIASGDTGLAADPGRLTVGPIVPVANANGYRAYRLLFPTVRDAAAANSMQVGEIELLDAGGNDVSAPGDAVVGVRAVAGSSVSEVAAVGTVAGANNHPAGEAPGLSIDNSAATKYLNFAELNTGIIVTPAGGAAPTAPTVTAVAAGPTATTMQLTTTPLVEGATYNLDVVFAVQDTAGQELTVTAASFVHGAGYEARRIRVSHNKTDDSGYYRNSDAVAKGIGDVVALGGGTFPPVESNTVFEDPIPDAGNNERFSSRISGVLNITTSGNYTFYMSSDDVGFLYLSTDDDPAKKVQIANEPNWNGRREYIAGGNQATRGVPPANISAPIALQAGGRYYLELIFTEGGGGNNGSATWLPPGGAAITNGSTPIPESAFTPSRISDGAVFTRLGPVQIVQQPQDALVPEGMPATFSVRADGTPNYTYQWRKNGVNIPGATSRSYTTPPVALSDEGAAFSVVVANEFSSATSADAILRSAGGDTTPPTLFSASGSADPTMFDLVYSEQVNEADAENLANYAVSGGVTLSSATLQADNRTVHFVSSPLNTAGVKTLTVNNVRDRAGTPNVIAANSQVTITYAEGRISYYQFDGIPGVLLTDAFNNPKFPNFPDRSEFRTSMEAPDSDGGNNFQDYVGQLQGYLTAPVSGQYTFYMSADDQGALYLSTDENPANKVEIAREPIWSGFRNYIGAADGGGRVCPGPNCNISQPITLQAGQRYYIEGLVKEAGGGDFISVAWQTPANGPQPNPVVDGMAPIPGAFLSPYTQPASVTPGTPADIATAAGLNVTFTAGINASAPLNVTWYRGGVEVPGETRASLSLTNVQLADSGSTFFVVVSNSFNVATSRVATLTVTTAPAPRLLAAQGGAFFEKVTLTFDQPLDATTAQDPFNYDISDGTASLLFGTPVLSADGLSVTLPLDPATLLREDTLYTVTVRNVQSRAGIVIDPNFDTTTFRSPVFSCGFLNFEVFNGSPGPLNAGLIGGTAVAGMTAHPTYPNSPSEKFFLPGFDTRLIYPGDAHENYGGRIRGLFVPPTSGNWLFYLRSDDASQLFFNPNGPDAAGAGTTPITEEPGCCAAFTAHVSAPQALVAGQRYYIEALYKEGGGGDYAQVAARLDTDTTTVLAPIPASQLGLYADATGALINITQQPTNQLFLIGGASSTAMFTVEANASRPGTPNQAIFYSWQRDGGAGFVAIPSSGSVLTIVPTAADNGARYRAILYIPGAVRTTDVATLTVAQPNTPPQFVCGPSQVVTQGVGAQVVPSWATGISPHSIVRNPVTFAADFTETNLPAGTRYFGTLAGRPVIQDGVLKLTIALDPGGLGGFAIGPFASQVFESLDVSWKSRVGGGGGGGADGYSLNIGNDLSDNFTGEEGTGTGLSVTVDTFDNGTGEDVGIDLKWLGARVAYAAVPKDDDGSGNYLRKDTFVNATLSVTPTGLATLTYDGNVLSAQLPGYTGVSVNQVNFGARTGGANDNQWIDDLNIAAFPTDASAAEANQVVSFNVSNDNPSLFSVQPAVAPNGTLTYTPAPTACGVANVTVVAMDNGGTANGGRDTSAPCTFTITSTNCVSNRAPTALSQAVTTGVNTPVNITLVGTDPDGDALSYAIVSGPANGTLSGTGATRVYTPNAGYTGPDSFTFTVNDGLLTSAPATVSITVLANPNRAPTALSQSVTTGLNTPVTITLVGTDPDGDALSYIVVGAPLHGTLSGSGATRTFTPTAGYSGADSFTFKVNDGLVDSALATVSITIRPNLNNNPVARIVASPLVDFSPSLANKVLIAGCGDENACLVLDGTQSTDADGDALTFSWFIEPSPVPFAIAPVVTNCFDLGEQTITLVAKDPNGGTGSAMLTIEVISVDEALGLLIDKVNSSTIARKNKRPFIATLKAATASSARGQCHTTANQLKAFQNKVRAQVSRDNPTEAECWTRWAQYVIDALNR